LHMDSFYNRGSCRRFAVALELPSMATYIFFSHHFQNDLIHSSTHLREAGLYQFWLVTMYKRMYQVKLKAQLRSLYPSEEVLADYMQIIGFQNLLPLFFGFAILHVLAGLVIGMELWKGICRWAHLAFSNSYYILQKLIFRLHSFYTVYSLKKKSITVFNGKDTVTVVNVRSLD
jgi:hypothetical protein